MLTLGLYFMAGVVQDFLIAKYYLALSSRSVWLASTLAGVITLFTLGVFNLSFGHWGRLLAYAVGTAVGTWVACKHGKREH